MYKGKKTPKRLQETTWLIEEDFLLTTTYIILKISAANVQLGQFSDCLNENSCTMVLKLRRLDGKVTDTGREFQIWGPQ